jgi:hypothetical protein
MNWSIYNTNNGKNQAACTFSGSAYHIVGRQDQYYPLTLCFARVSKFANFALQVNMTLMRNNDGSVGTGSGGLIYRAQVQGPSLSNLNSGTMYRTRVNPNDGSYDFYVQNTSSTPLRSGRLGICPNAGTSPLISENGRANINQHVNYGVNQVNMLMLIAKGSAIALFINGYEIEVVCDTTSQSGLIGFFTAPTPDNVTDIAYTNMEIWKL